ncbi:MAG: Crp/Fnr family transcriptional regulator [Cyanobacteria bacterium J06641_5]
MDSNISPAWHQQVRSILLATGISLSEVQWGRFTEILHWRQWQEREYVILPGSIQHELYFVCEGLLRVYYTTDTGKEANKAFISENSFAAPLAASALELPLIYGVQALETSAIAVASYAEFIALFDLDPIFDRLGRKIAETILIRKELRMRSLLQQNASERYVEFVRQFPELVQRIPQYHIASYLGISEVSLSRLKGQIAPQFA